MELVAQRHGSPAGTVVTDLIAWARRRTEAFELSPYRDARLDRLPISETADPELWFQLDRSGSRPWQWGCGVRADGRVVIPFHYYREHFASEPARAELWERLNAIPGLGLERNLTGRPTFTLRALAEPETRKRFVEVLDYLMDASLATR